MKFQIWFLSPINANENIERRKNTVKKIFLLTILILAGQTSNAISDACSLMQIEIPASLNMSQNEITLYQQRLRTECWWTQAYRQFRSDLQTKFQLTPDLVTEYQAMRFVRRVDFENSKNNNIPIEKTYQILRSQYALPNDQKSSVIWDNWVKGIAQLIPAKQSVLNGDFFDYEKLKKVHIGFFQLSNEVGDDANPPDVGVIKPPVPEDNYWWDFATQQEADAAKVIVDGINDYYRSMGLLPHFADDKLNRILDVRLAVKRQPSDKQNVIEYVNVIFSGQSRANLTHIQNILDFVRTMLSQALQNQPLVWNNKVMTPAEVAYLAQKFYVGVHPFSEGNGRTSRFIQELVLTTMDMPHGSSGDLMDSDVLTSFPDYYNQAMTANIKLMQTMKNCVNLYAQSSPDDSSLPYSCRVLKTKN